MSATADSPQRRQLILCCDGTNNNLTGRDKDTNVVKLCDLLRSAPDSERIVFYDPGVGNPGELPGATLWDKINRYAERIAGLAFGRGVYENVAECYTFLMQHYRPGDEIYIFGFSRGSFTARSVAGMVNQFGLLQPHMTSMVATLLHIYFADRENAEEHRKRIAKETTDLFSTAETSYVEIQFVGVWDTVASVGMWPFDAKFTAIPTIKGKRFRNVRHALALDEQRAQFGPRLYSDDNGTYLTERGNEATLEQLWFSGVHCDVGGGYAPDASALSHTTLIWLVTEAYACGLRLPGCASAGDVRRMIDTAFAVQAASMPVSHSETRNDCRWALTGLAVRDTNQVSISGSSRPPVPVKAVEHPSVALLAARPDFGSTWRILRPKGWFALTCLAALMILSAYGQLLTHQTFTDSLWQDLRDAAARLPDYLRQVFAFVQWKICWIMNGDPAIGLNGFRSPRWAVVWSIPLTVLLAIAAAWFVAPSFAKLAGFRRAGLAVPRWLNRLGWALPVALFAGVGSAGAAWLTITLAVSKSFHSSYVTGVLMTLLAVISIAGWVGVLALILLGALRRAR